MTPDEEQLIRWMLEHGIPEAQAFLSQLEKAKATAGVVLAVARASISL